MSFGAVETAKVSIEKFELKEITPPEYTWEVTVVNKGGGQTGELTLQILHKIRKDNYYYPIARMSGMKDGTQTFSFIPEKSTRILSGTYIFYYPYDRLRAQIIQHGQVLAQKDIDLPKLSIKIGPVSFSPSDSGRVNWSASVTNEGILPIHALIVETFRKTSSHGNWMGAGSFFIGHINLKQNETMPISSYATISDVPAGEYLYLRIRVIADEGPIESTTEAKYLPPQDKRPQSPAGMKQYKLKK